MATNDKSSAMQGPAGAYVQHPHPCPSCGHCPTCGRGGYRTYPYQPYPYFPWWSTTPYYTTGGGTYTITTTGANSLHG